ncbi:MAG: hypothetical protein V1848_04095, partial [Candidatus Magasanikbacteria bacterium]
GDQLFTRTTFGEKTLNVFNYDKSTEDREKLFKAESVALGDLHASAKKLVEGCIATGLVEFPDEKIQQAFINLYGEIVDLKKEAYRIEVSHPDEKTKDEKMTLRNQRKEKTRQLIELIKTLQWTGGTRELVLIGDTIIDRGLSDKVMLDLLKHMREKGAKITTLASNHDLDFYMKNVSGDREQSLSYHGGAIKPEKEEYREHLRHTKLFHYDALNNIFYAHAYQTQEKLDEFRKHINFTEEITQQNIQNFVVKANEWYTEQIKALEQNTCTAEDKQMIFDITWGVGYRDPNEDPQKIEASKAFNNTIKTVCGHDNALEQVNSTGKTDFVQAISLNDLHNRFDSKTQDHGTSFRLFLLDHVKREESPTLPEEPKKMDQAPSPPISPPEIQKTKEPILSQAELGALLAGMNLGDDEEPEIETTAPEIKPSLIHQAPQEIESVLSPPIPEPETEEVLPHAKFDTEDELTIYQKDGNELTVAKGDTVEYIAKNGKKQNYTIIKIDPKLQKIQLQNTQRKGLGFAIGENNLIDNTRFKKIEEETEPILTETTEKTPEEVIPGQGEELIAIEETPIEEITEREKEPTDLEKLSTLIKNYGDTSVIIEGTKTSPQVEKNENTGTLTFRYGEKQYITFFVENEIIKAKYSIKENIEKEIRALGKGITDTNLSGLLKAIQGEFRETWEMDQVNPSHSSGREKSVFKRELQEKSDVINLLQKYELTEDDKQKLQAYYDFLSGNDMRNLDLLTTLQMNRDTINQLKEKIKNKLQGINPEKEEEEHDEQNDGIEEETEEEIAEKKDDHPIKSILNNWIPGEQVLLLSKRKDHEMKTSFAIENAPPCELEETEQGIRFFYGDDFALEITPHNDTVVIEYFVDKISKKRITINTQKKKNVTNRIIFFRDMARKLYTGKKENEIPKETTPSEEIPAPPEDPRQEEYDAGMKEIEHRIIDAKLQQYVLPDPEQKFDLDYIEKFISESFFNTLNQVLNGHENIPDIYIADRTEAGKMGEEKIKIAEDKQGKIITINPTQANWPGELSQYLIQNP